MPLRWLVTLVDTEGVRGGGTPGAVHASAAAWSGRGRITQQSDCAAVLGAEHIR